MKLSAPKTVVWVIALIIGLLGLLCHLGVAIPFICTYAFWLVVVAWLLLLLATLLKGL